MKNTGPRCTNCGSTLCPGCGSDAGRYAQPLVGPTCALCGRRDCKTPGACR